MKHDECSIAHLTMIQAIVSRLETNCFTLKAIAMTLTAAVLAFSGSLKDPNWVYPLAGCLPVIVFWILDASYLRFGRMFRTLYDDVRQGKVDELFCMNISQYKNSEQSTLRIMFSWSVVWYYLSILVTFLIIMCKFIKFGG